MNLRPISASIILCSIQSTTTNVGLRNKRICIPLCMGNKYIGMELRLIESYQSKMRNLIGCMICIQNEKTSMRFTSMPKIYSSYRPYNNLTFVLNLNSIDNILLQNTLHSPTVKLIQLRIIGLKHLSRTQSTRNKKSNPR